MSETIPISPADLLIDEENPRISQPNIGQHKAIQALAQHLQRKVQVLAGHIVRHGLNPSELPIVMPLADGTQRYTVLEGNRRLVALRALENPDSLGDSISKGILSQIRRLSREYQKSPIDTVTCLVVRDRDEARPWIELRHTGLNNGAGLFPWGSDESARFRARTGNPEAHTQALDFLQRRGDLTAEVRRSVPATTLKRLIETPAVRSKLGLEVLGGTLYLLAEEKRIAKALMHIVSDLVSGRTKVSDVYKKQQRVHYANHLPSDVIVTATIKSGQGIAATTGGAATSPKAAQKVTARSARTRDKLIPRDCVLNIPAGRVQNIEGELRKLSLDNHTNAVSVLFRVFIELCVDSYLVSSAVDSPDEHLHKKLEKVVTDLLARKKISRQQATPVRRACQKDSFLAPSVNLMHQYVHNAHVFPAPTDLRAHWDSLQPFVVAIWAP